MVKPNVLVLGGDDDAYHDFTITGSVFDAFLKKAGCDVTISEDTSCLVSQNINAYDILVCWMNRKNIRPEEEKGLIDGVIGSPWGNTGKPKAFIGIHIAACSFAGSETYHRMTGCRFLTHPEFGEEYPIKVVNPHHPVMAGMDNFTIKDELYLMEVYPPFETLLTCHYKGYDRPVAWIKPYGRGYVFYLALGHGAEQLNNPFVKRIITNAVIWTFKAIAGDKNCV
jgi:type 1 glutamine amidotransferase